MKRPERSRRSRRLGFVETLETRSLLTMVATAPLPNLDLAPGAAATPVALDAHFKDADASPDFAIFDTSLGTIPVLLTPKTTPLTVANFQNYVNKGAYTNAIVHRSVPGFIWQSGGYQLTSTPNIAPIAADAPVQNEFGASNVRGTIAMAKLGNNPNSATSQFFFNESDTNAANLDNQNGGFTVFGRVVGAEGLAVMDAVAGVPVPSPGPLASPLNEIPLMNYVRGTAVQPSNLVLIKGVATASEYFVASSTAPGVATASVQGDRLTVTPLAAGTAQITIVGYGSDGVAASQTFSVTVSPATQPPSTPTPSPTPTPTPTPTPSPTPTPTPNPTPTPTPSPTPTPTPSPTQTPTPTPTTPPPVVQPPIGIPTPPPVTVPASVLIPAARGNLPASVVAGQKARIQQVVTLRNPSSGEIAQRARVTMTLSADRAGSADDITIAAASAKVKLRAGKQGRLKLAANRVKPTVPPGTYHVLITVTDPDGARTTLDTGRTLTVRAPLAKPPRGRGV